jgi:hypothetical protein
MGFQPVSERASAAGGFGPSAKENKQDADATLAARRFASSAAQQSSIGFQPVVERVRSARICRSAEERQAGCLCYFSGPPFRVVPPRSKVA